MTKRTKRTILWSLLAVLVIVVGFLAYYFTAIYNQVDHFQKTGEDSPFYQVKPTETTKTPEPPKWEGTDRVNILLMGVDARGLKKGEIPRSDTMLVASLDPVTKRGYLFSIMRDTYVKVPEYGMNRINTAITHGPNTAMKTVSDLLGIPIQYYVYTDFQGFIELVDAIGGVDFYVEKDMHYTSKADNHEYDIDLKQGQQHLDGKTALQYVRFRHDALSDYSRTERQRNFLTAVANKMISTTSLLKLPAILEKVNPYIDTNLTINDMWKLANLGYSSKMIASEQIPPMSLLIEKNVGGAEVLGVKSDEELKAYVQEVFNRTEDTSTDEQNSGNNSNSTTNGSNSAPKIKNEAADTSSGP
ncbi:LCP family protein [Paenibacillus lutimineralis]|uniref:LytR family transcriptional regulator n=1 Tax=Paenibacillus lutimineralis TaxID=2707005 RepID=A0A3S9UTU5_9BACL|nr:LCP family protein [Paenibacillus lutimineralis]AZS13691.1 LytR family transcriptional regulator [Paenibacillus lutimineralis]